MLVRHLRGEQQSLEVQNVLNERERIASATAARVPLLEHLLNRVSQRSSCVVDGILIQASERGRLEGVDGGNREARAAGPLVKHWGVNPLLTQIERFWK